jgi:hypothetical protein
MRMRQDSVPFYVYSAAVYVFFFFCVCTTHILVEKNAAFENARRYAGICVCIMI